MKLRSLFFGTLCMLMLGVSFTSCSDDDDDSKKNDEGSKVELPENRVYILNEGSYQKNNRRSYGYGKTNTCQSNNRQPCTTYQQGRYKELGVTEYGRCRKAFCRNQRP